MMVHEAGQFFSLQHICTSAYNETMFVTDVSSSKQRKFSENTQFLLQKEDFFGAYISLHNIQKVHCSRSDA
jgi:hypothetical protein